MISVCLLTKNEEKLLPRCLASVQGAELVVVDTGSVDGTKAIAERAGARVMDFVWTDNFSEARNCALDVARHSWVLWLDADMWLPEGELGYLEKFAEQAPPDIDGLSVTIIDPSGSFASARLIRRECRFFGSVHENPACTNIARTPCRIFHEREETEYDRFVKEAKYRRLLEAELKKSPDDARALGFLRDLSFEQQDYAQAKALAIRHAATGPDYMNDLILSKLSLREGSAHTALVMGLSALALGSADPRAYMAIGMAYERLGRKLEAVTFYSHGARIPAEVRAQGSTYPVSQEEYDTLPLIRMAQTYADMGLVLRAKELLREALARHPKTHFKDILLEQLGEKPAKPADAQSDISWLSEAL